ncbi:tRNA 2-thiouridine(34) synthase MnmA [Roseospira visakhapatnamensis]|uniref:tRNA 2-thiouridine(34) synthase MnmA n=1 Tax=Roseospira visakhapatnamensis TaxID=390880 RepID=UPI002483BEFF|nr:tRNA 2-thiouridine(34) synthase MnmA [Roseospira visakhapatnamensis]
MAPGRGRRAVVAMSGGVDSSVTAALLVEAGYDVVGLTMQLYDQGQAVAGGRTCCAGQDIHDARRVADRLGIPHYVVDYEGAFRRDVMERFADSYVRGETPVPCVLCNQTVKFRDLLGAARDLGAEILATGHYVRRREAADGPALWRGRDSAKDQSYFLFATTRAHLAMLRFPLGDLTKDQTRALARRHGLAVAGKAESQDICFVPGGDYARVVERLRPGALDPGDIVDQAGRVLGRHDGIMHYTVGQRRGLGIGGTEAPLYVLQLRPGRREVVVGPREALARDRFALHGLNWLGPGTAPPETGIRAMVKIRNTFDPVPATVEVHADARARVTLETPAHGVAPGQACVLYEGERVLGGGWIAREGLSE